MGVAAVGAGMQAGGQISSGYGQNQALRAMGDVWDDQQRHQADADAQLRARADRLLAGVGVEQLTNQAGQTQMRTDLDAVARNTTKAASSNAKRRGKLNPEESARLSRAFSDERANSSSLADVLARLQAFRDGAQDIDMLGRQFAVDRGQITLNAREWAGLAPLQLQAAGQRGATARVAGQGMQAAGQGLMQYGMTQPSDSYSNSPYVTQRPQGPARR